MAHSLAPIPNSICTRSWHKKDEYFPLCVSFLLQKVLSQRVSIVKIWSDFPAFVLCVCVCITFLTAWTFFLFSKIYLLCSLLLSFQWPALVHHCIIVFTQLNYNIVHRIENSMVETSPTCQKVSLKWTQIEISANSNLAEKPDGKSQITEEVYLAIIHETLAVRECKGLAKPSNVDTKWKIKWLKNARMHEQKDFPVFL